uniref:Uncharacterized protein n=1 Tax=Physcomitrium patens TaxID=3218 RepID=A0A2K1J0A0_PHYPA|nr:hypothetical protein PHYPA_022852 [Physcomitrium patens]
MTTVSSACSCDSWPSLKGQLGEPIKGFVTHVLFPQSLPLSMPILSFAVPVSVSLHVHAPEKGLRCVVISPRLDCCDDKEDLARLHFAAHKDSVFVLDPELDQSIVELKGHKYAETKRRITIPKQTGRGSSLKTLNLNSSQTALHACNGLILVIVGGFSSKHPDKTWRLGYQHCLYMYDMSRGTWWTLPSLEKEYGVYAYNARDISESLMCKLNWWARS